MKLNGLQKTCLVYLGGLVVYWLLLRHSGLQTSNWNYGYSLAFTMIPLFGGFLGMLKSGIWGGLKSSIGRAVFFLSLGLFLWGCGNSIWAYYNFVLHQAAPYPSLADIGFAPSIFFWGVGVVFLSKASGAKFALRNTWAKVLAVVLPLGVLALSKWLLIDVARQGAITTQGSSGLKLLLDIAYPLGDLMALTLAVVIFGLSLRFLGGKYRWAILSILLGLAVMYVGDFWFSYTTTVSTFFNGDLGDMILTLGLFFLTFGDLGFMSKPQLGAKEDGNG